MTIFLGCGFGAKYREGGGVLSVPLQWMLGLRRLKLDAIWLELLPATDDLRTDRARLSSFQRRLREHGLAGRYCLLYEKARFDIPMQRMPDKAVLHIYTNRITLAL